MSFISKENDYRLGKYKINLAFDAVLEVQNLFKEEITDIEKIEVSLNILVINRGALRKLNFQQKSELLAEIFEEFIDVKGKRKPKNPKKLFDFEEDGNYIYSSFFADYGIDLIEQQGKLQWDKFIALFQGLGDKTKIKEIMSIRGRDLPQPTAYNQEEIENLRELKSYYALGDTEESYNEGLKSLWNTLEGMAE
jgi:hypothetical protein